MPIPADMAPWPGGPCRPADAVDDYVLMADGKFGLSNDLPGEWSEAGHQLSRRGRPSHTTGTKAEHGLSAPDHDGW